MKSTAPWSVKGIERDARETAKEAARKQGLTVGEWLNKTIYSAGDGSFDGDVDSLSLKDIAFALSHLSERLASAEARVADAEDKRDEILGSLSAAQGKIAERLQRLEASGPSKTDQNGGGTSSSASATQIAAIQRLEQALGHVAQQFNLAQKNSSDRLEKNEQALIKLAQKIAADDVQRANASPSGPPSEFIENTEKKLRVLGDEIKRGGGEIRALEGTLEKLSSHIEAAERRSAVAVEKMAESVTALKSEIAALQGTNTGFGTGNNHSEITAEIASLSEKTDQQINALHEAVQDLAERLGDLGNAASPDSHSQALSQPTDAASRGIGSSALDQLKNSGNPAPTAGTPSPLPSNIPSSLSTATQNEHDELLADVQAVFGMSETDDPEASKPSEENGQRVTEDKTNNQLTVSEKQSEMGSAESASVDDIDDIMAELDALGFGAEGQSPSEPEGFDHADATQATSPLHHSGSDLENNDDDQPLANGLTSAHDIDPLTDNIFEKASQPLTSDEASSSNRDLNIDAPNGNGSDFGNGSDVDDNHPYDDHNEIPGYRRAGEGALAETESATASAPASSGGPGSAHSAKETYASPNELPPPAPKQRRRLTPRQRAILQEKIRRKRAAALQATEVNSSESEKPVETIETTPDPVPTAKSAFSPASLLNKGRSLISGNKSTRGEDTSESDEFTNTNEDKYDGSALGTEETSLATSFESKNDSITDTFGDPFHNHNQAPEEFAEDTDDEDNPSPPGFPGLGFIANRPVTVALGGAILLTTTALGFSMRDYLFASDNPSAKIASTAASGIDANAKGTASGEDTPNAYASDTITREPRPLFLEAMTKFSAASTPEEETEALETLRQAASLGHPPAQLQLGEYYKIGQFVQEDAAQARSWYKQAADGGNILAMHRVGVMAARGEGGPLDLEISIRWFERAANFGLVDSQYNLGATFHPTDDGSGTEYQDRAKAYYWYSIAGLQGDQQAIDLASGIADGLDPAQKQELDEQIASWTAAPSDPTANEQVGT
ncbi:MAG: hypothetical protein AAF720_02390 [Pseudomonadota bacterium]